MSDKIWALLLMILGFLMLICSRYSDVKVMNICGFIIGFITIAYGIGTVFETVFNSKSE